MSAKTQYPGCEELAKAKDSFARTPPGKSQIMQYQKASFLEDVGIKVVNKTEGAKSHIQLLMQLWDWH